MLAIIIPYYKITFFEATLQSLANQTNQQFKVYIGDDASLENPSILLEKFKGQFKFEVHRFDENLGGNSLTKQWERCIALSANEEWLMILGDDDVLGENVVEEFYNNLPVIKYNDCKIVRYATVVIDEQLNTKSNIFEHPILEYGLEYFSRKLKGGTRSSMSEFFFKKETYLKFKFVSYAASFYSDDRALLDFSNNKPIYTINTAVVFIRISDYSISGGDNKVALLDAELHYLKYIYHHKFKYFNKTDKLLILNRFENALNKNKVKTIYLWVQLYLSYLLNFDKIQFIKFNKRLARKILNK